MEEIHWSKAKSTIVEKMWGGREYVVSVEPALDIDEEGKTMPRVDFCGRRIAHWEKDM